MTKPDITEQMLSDFVFAILPNYSAGKVVYNRGAKGASPEIKTEGELDFETPGVAMSEDAIVGIGSITKQFVAATLLKLWDEEILEGGSVNFPKGIDTKLSHFMEKMKKRFPDAISKFEEFEAKEFFDDVSLRDLLNHTHGLGQRDDKKVNEFMYQRQQTTDEPLTLSEVISFTVSQYDDAESAIKREKDGKIRVAKQSDQHGRFKYSNLGYDLAAMVIESITGENFEEVVKQKVLEPNLLNSTYTQGDHARLYRERHDVARGFTFHPDEEEKKHEVDFNTMTNTRAAGGFKSTVADLDRFARAYMGGEMFKSEVVREAVKNYSEGALTPAGYSGLSEEELSDNNGLAGVAGYRYHLGIMADKNAVEGRDNGLVGHSGNDYVYNSNLRYNPITGAVTSFLETVDQITPVICQEVLKERGSRSLETINRFWTEKAQPLLASRGYPELGGKEYCDVITGLLADDRKAFEAIREYSDLRQGVLSIPRDYLVKNRENITQISERLIENERGTEGLWVEKMKDGKRPDLKSGGR